MSRVGCLIYRKDETIFISGQQLLFAAAGSAWTQLLRYVGGKLQQLEIDLLIRQDAAAFAVLMLDGATAIMLLGELLMRRIERQRSACIELDSVRGKRQRSGNQYRACSRELHRVGGDIQRTVEQLYASPTACTLSVWNAE